jgi:oligoribonuclease
MSQANDLPAGSAPVAATPRQNEFNLVWVDMEMTGLEPDTDRITAARA